MNVNWYAKNAHTGIGRNGFANDRFKIASQQIRSLGIASVDYFKRIHTHTHTCKLIHLAFISRHRLCDDESTFGPWKESHNRPIGCKNASSLVEMIETKRQSPRCSNAMWSFNEAHFNELEAAQHLTQAFAWPGGFGSNLNDQPTDYHSLDSSLTKFITQIFLVRAFTINGNESFYNPYIHSTIPYSIHQL